MSSTNEILNQILASRRASKEQKESPKTTEQINEEIHNNKVKDSTQIRWLRWILAGVIVVIAIAHLGVLYYFLDKAGNHNILLKKQFISDKVMLMFLGTTTADVFGLLFILVRYLFPNQVKK